MDDTVAHHRVGDGRAQPDRDPQAFIGMVARFDFGKTFPQIDSPLGIAFERDAFLIFEQVAEKKHLAPDLEDKGPFVEWEALLDPGERQAKLA